MSDRRNLLKRVNQSVYRQFIWIFNFMTGWYESEAVKVTNSTHTFSEMELAALSTDLAQVTGFSFSVWFSALFFAGIIYKKRRKSMKPDPL